MKISDAKRMEIVVVKTFLIDKPRMTNKIGKLRKQVDTILCTMNKISD